MDLPTLCAGLIEDAQLQLAITHLVQLKAEAKESDVVQRNAVL